MLRYGRYNTCVKLLESGSAGPKAINEMDGEGHSPLHCAAGAGHVKLVRLLLARGATCTKYVIHNTINIMPNPINVCCHFGGFQFHSVVRWKM